MTSQWGAEKAAAGLEYVMAIDPATMGDRYAFVIAHRDADLVVCDYCQILKPPVNPVDAEDLLRDLIRRFRPYKIRCDTAATVQRLQAEIPELEYTPFTRPMKLRIYDRIAVRNMPAVVAIHAGKCGGCHLKVSSEVESAARGKTVDPLAQLPTCDQCGRVVYWEA